MEELGLKTILSFVYKKKKNKNRSKHFDLVLPRSSKMKSPWDINSLYDFLYFNCPLCPYKNNSKQKFVNHACSVHPEAGPYLKNIQDDSIFDVHIPYHEYKSESKDEIENENKYENENEDTFTITAKSESDNVKVEEYQIKEELENFALPYENDYIENEEFSQDDFEQNENNAFDHEVDIEDNLEEEDLKLEEKNFKCKICYKFFSTKYRLTKHVSIVHDGEKNHKCPLCIKRFIDQRALNVHLKKSHNESINTRDESDEQQHCPICDKIFINKKSLYHHNKKFHINYQCEWCEESFSLLKGLKKHIFSQHREKSNINKVQCEKCSQMVKKSYYDEHMARVHPEENEDLMEKCEKCNLLVLKVGMKRHFLRMHSEDPCQCDFCGKEYSNQIKLKNHIYNKHKDKQQIRKYDLEKIPRVDCPKCQKSIRKCNIETHILKCQIKCDLCAIEFSNMLEYKSHIKEVHPNPRVTTKVKCEICGKTYLQATIKQHIKSVHEKIKDFQCPKCGKAFSEKASLKDHDKIHTGIRDFGCDQCGKTYRRSDRLKNHIRVVHEGRKDYVCSDCGKSFGDTNNLKRHNDIIHKGIKRFKCDYCTNAYGQSPELKKHLEVCHKKN